jgi:hypothetical protein
LEPVPLLPSATEQTLPLTNVDVCEDPKRLKREWETPVAEGNNGTGSNFFPGSRILFPSLVGPQEKGRNETSNIPFYFEYLPCGPPFISFKKSGNLVLGGGQ